MSRFISLTRRSSGLATLILSGRRRPQFTGANYAACDFVPTIAQTEAFNQISADNIGASEM